MTPTEHVQRKAIYESTPYGIVQRGDKWVVAQTWWNKDIETFKTREAAKEGLERIAKAAGCWRKVRI